MREICHYKENIFYWRFLQRFLVLKNLEKFSKKPPLQSPLLAAEVLTDVPYN
jgi:hypothetical protein